MNINKPVKCQVELGVSSICDGNGAPRTSDARHGVTRGKKNPLYSMLSHRLVHLRAATVFSQRELADLADVSDVTISALERGEAVSKISTIEQVATALGVSPVWLAFGDDGHLPWRQRHRRFGVGPADPPTPTPAQGGSYQLYRGMGERLRAARVAKGLSMRALGREAGCTVAAISLLEAGTSIVLLSTCEELAKALDVAPGWLAYGIGTGPAPN